MNLIRAMMLILLFTLAGCMGNNSASEEDNINKTGKLIREEITMEFAKTGDKDFLGLETEVYSCKINILKPIIKTVEISVEFEEKITLLKKIEIEDNSKENFEIYLLDFLDEVIITAYNNTGEKIFEHTLKLK